MEDKVGWLDFEIDIRELQQKISLIKSFVNFWEIMRDLSIKNLFMEKAVF